MTRRVLTGVAAATLAASTLTALGAPAEAAQKPGGGHGRVVDLQVLSFNDLHGNLEPPSGSSGRVVTGHKIDPATGKPVDVTVDAGGAEYLSSTLQRLRSGQRHSLTVSVGDNVGGSPLLSAAFHDEPTVDAMNVMGTSVSAVGNHEFDEGSAELLRMQRGGCLPDGDGKDNQNSCPSGTFQGAGFQMLTANVRREDTGKTLLPPYTVRKIKGVKVAFVGLTLKETPSIVSAEGVKGLRFTDEVKEANRLVPILKRQGINAVVALVHQGADVDKERWTAPDGTTHQVNPAYDVPCAKGGSMSAGSPILPIARGLDPAYDAVLTGHTHQSYVCKVADPSGTPRVVSSGLSFGRLVTETTLPYDRARKDVVRPMVRSRNVIVSRDQAKDPRVTSIISAAKKHVGPIESKVLGTISTDVTRTANPAGESQLGDLIADSQLGDPTVVTGGKKPQIAFMNPGGIRSDLPYAPDGGKVTYGDAFAVQPFNNYNVSLDLTGADLYALLNQQWNGSFPKILQVSKGFSYAWTSSGGKPHVVDGSMRLNGEPVDKAKTYRVVTNNFLQGCGDDFSVFTKGTAVHYGGLDIDALARHLSAASPYTPGPLTRITQQ